MNIKTKKAFSISNERIMEKQDSDICDTLLALDFISLTEENTRLTFKLYN